MKMELPEIPPEERTPLVEALLAIIRQLFDRCAQLEETNRQLRDEIAILKGQKPRPQIKPSSLETNKPPSQDTADAPAKDSAKRPGSAKRSKNSELVIHQRVNLHIENLPTGAVFKCYEEYFVQDLIIESKNTLYRRARYLLPDGGSILAPLPDDVPPGKHFGSTLLSHVLHQYHNSGVTQGLLLQSLHDYGVDISEGELNRLLTEKQDVFHQEKEEVRAAGLMTASYLGTDDTGARHRGKNGFSTFIGNDLFSYFESTDSKSRLNFLELLQGSERRYVINDVAIAYWQREKLSVQLVAKLSVGPRHFADHAAWEARLRELPITGDWRERRATEGVLLGGLVELGVSAELVILSDGAPQFVVLLHAACWVHAERPLARMIPHTEEHRVLIEKVRDQIWELYRDLKAYRAQPDASQKPLLEARFDALCDQSTGYPSINNVLKEMREHKADLLRVLDRPEVPLHNNGAESDIREYVKKRKISGGTRSEAGRRCRDTFVSLKKTCRKLAINFWRYLQDRIRGRQEIPRLGDLIRKRSDEMHAPNVQAVPA